MRILDGEALSPAITSIVAKAEKTVSLVSPYFEPWTQLSAALHRALAKGVAVRLLLRGGDDAEKRKAAAEPFERAGAELLVLDRLHAKIYLSERTALLTSMNLVEASRSSWEIGASIDAAQDAVTYNAVAASLEQLIRDADLPPAATAPRRKHGPAVALVEVGPEGVCIRCGDSVAQNPDRPFCRACYREWADAGKDDGEEEVYCHICGEEAETSMAKPLCRGCWRVNR